LGCAHGGGRDDPRARTRAEDGGLGRRPAATPFRISAVRLRGVPHLQGITTFPELNVREYTTIDGQPGIWFMSLDAASAVAVIGARRTYRLPYFLYTLGERADVLRADIHHPPWPLRTAEATFELNTMAEP
jgi:hypothetical protein